MTLVQSISFETQTVLRCQSFALYLWSRVCVCVCVEPEAWDTWERFDHVCFSCALKNTDDVTWTPLTNFNKIFCVDDVCVSVVLSRSGLMYKGIKGFQGAASAGCHGSVTSVWFNNGSLLHYGGNAQHNHYKRDWQTVLWFCDKRFIILCQNNKVRHIWFMFNGVIWHG